MANTAKANNTTTDLNHKVIDSLLRRSLMADVAKAEKTPTFESSNLSSVGVFSAFATSAIRLLLRHLIEGKNQFRLGITEWRRGF